MEKIININFQGRLITIEEPAYEILKQYSDNLRRHFAGEESSDEIISDIENRIAELLSAQLRQGATCITTADMNNVLDSIGRIEDMEAETGAGNDHNNSTQSAAREERFYRSADDKIIAGVCSGIAHRLNMDTTIVRIIFFLFLGAFFWIYILLWIIVPSGTTHTRITRRLFRDRDSKVIAGVCSGLAHYFNTESWKIRIVFMFPFVVSVLFNSVHLFSWLWWGVPHGFITGYFGSTFFVLYIVLWIAIPYANSPTDKMEMRGEKVDINTIKAATQARTSSAYYPPQRPGATFGRVMGILFKGFFLLTGGSIALGLFATLVGLAFAASVVMPMSDFILSGSTQHFLVWTGAILTLSVPFIAIVVWIIRRLMRVRSRSHYLGFVFTFLWMAGIVCLVIAAGAITRSFSSKSMVEKEVTIQQPPTGKLYVAVSSQHAPWHYNRYSRWFGDWDDEDNPFRIMDKDSLWLNTIKVNIEQSKDSLFHVYQTASSRGTTSSEAKQLAGNIIFEMQQHDSIITLPKGFTISNKEKFRNQQILVTIEVPLGKTVQVSKAVNEYSWFTINGHGNGVYYSRRSDDGGRRNYGVDKEYIMTAGGLKRLNDTTTTRHNGEGEDEDNDNDD